MSHTTQLLKTERQALTWLAGIFSLRMLGLFMILPVFALYAKNFSGTTQAKVGMALGIYGLMQALFQAPLGYISDRLGRKPVIILGLCMFALGSLVAAMSTSMMGIILGRGLQGTAAVGSVIMAWVSDLTREEVRLKAMATLGISIGGSFALALLLGPIFSAWVGISGIFWFICMLSLCAIVIVLFCIPNPVSSSAPNMPMLKPSRPLTQSLPASPVQPQLFPIYFGIFALHACLTAIFLKLPLVLQPLLFGMETLHFYLPVFLASIVVTLLSISWLEKRSQTYRDLLLPLVVLLFSLLGMAFNVHSLIGLGMMLFLFFTAFNLLEVSLPAYLSKRVHPQHKGLALGIFSSLQFLGLFMGGVVGGFLDEYFGMFAVFLFCVILALTWTVWFFLIQERG